VAEAAPPSLCSTIAVGLDPAAQVTRDWLVTGSGFDRARFEAFWRHATRFLTAGADATEVPTKAARMSHAQGAIALARKI